MQSLFVYTISGGCQVYVFDSQHGTEAEVCAKKKYILLTLVHLLVLTCEFFINARTLMTLRPEISVAQLISKTIWTKFM